MILELASEGISLNVFIFKPFSNKRRIKRCGANWRAALIGGNTVGPKIFYIISQNCGDHRQNYKVTEAQIF